MIPVLLTVFMVVVLWAGVLLLKGSIWIAAAGTAALALTWAGAVAWRLFQARRGAQRIEASLKDQGDAHARDARPDQLGELDAMKAEFAKAVASLKTSKLARGGRDALAVLPWYLIIGPPGAGKSTALRASGLKFPYLSKRGGVRGIGGTRNCEWWLNNEAVILDTAGRYATQDEDHEEWLGFLDVLARARPRKPVNGLLVAIPITDLSGEQEDDAAALGKRMRERVDEVTGRLRVVLPVYVLLTKCDLLPGFVETFASLRKADRNQVWGVTFPAGDENVGLFAERFDELVSVVEHRTVRRLGEERRLADRERIYELPQQLAASKPQLAAFLEGLFDKNVYQETPVLRGLYLTSGTQEGRTVDRVMAAMASAFGIRAGLHAPVAVAEAKSYFLKDVFEKVLFPDQHLASLSAAGRRRERGRLALMVGAAAVAVAVFAAWPVRSFLFNRSLLRSTEQVVVAAAAKAASMPRLEELSELRETIERLEAFERDGVPLSMGMGFYRAGELLPVARRVHAAAFRRLWADPVLQRDEEELRGGGRRSDRPVGEAGDWATQLRLYEAVKLHLLLSQPKGAAEPVMDDKVCDWVARGLAAAAAGEGRAGGASAASLARGVEAHGRVYARAVAAEPGLARARSVELVAQAQRTLGRSSVASMAVEVLSSRVDRTLDLSLASMVQPLPAGLSSTRPVRGAFTRQGYVGITKALLEHPETIVEPWVVSVQGGLSKEDLELEREKVRTRYFERYIEEWRRFLDGVEVGRSGEPALMLDQLTAGESTPYQQLFRAVAVNTRLLSPAEAAVGAAASAVGDTLRGGERRLGPNDVATAFDGFVKFGTPAEALVPTLPGAAPKAPARTPLDGYVEQLVILRDAQRTAATGGDEEKKQFLAAAQKAQSAVNNAVRGAEGGWGPRLAALLGPPVDLLARDARMGPCRTAAAAWCDLVVKPVRSRLAARYPFARDGQDAALFEVAEVFQPETGIIWAFYKKMLEGAVARSGEGFKFAGEVGEACYQPVLLGFLRQAQDVTSALYGGASQEAGAGFLVKFRPHPRVSRVSLQVDGQSAEYANGPEEWYSLAWPSKAGGTRGAALRIRTADGQELEPRRGEGEWGLLRLLEQGTVRGVASPREFSVGFDFPRLGSSVIVDFKMDRNQSPFLGSRPEARGRLLAPFRSFPVVPPSIGRAGGCE